MNHLAEVGSSRLSHGTPPTKSAHAEHSTHLDVPYIMTSDCLLTAAAIEDRHVRGSGTEVKEVHLSVSSGVVFCGFTARPTGGRGGTEPKACQTGSPSTG